MFAHKLRRRSCYHVGTQGGVMPILLPDKQRLAPEIRKARLFLPSMIYKAPSKHSLGVPSTKSTPTAGQLRSKLTLQGPHTLAFVLHE